MQIHFDKLETQVINGMKGGQGEARLQSYSDGVNKIMKLVLAPGAFLGEHTMWATARRFMCFPAQEPCSAAA